MSFDPLNLYIQMSLYCKPELNFKDIHKIPVSISMDEIEDIMNAEQPNPLNNGIEVTPKLIEWIQSQEKIEKIVKDDVIALVRSRYELGLQRYGQPLMTEDGRITIKDALDELGDLLQYVYKGKLNREDMQKVKNMMPVLQLLLDTTHP